MKLCPKCNSQLDDKINYCITCGFQFSQLSQQPILQTPMPPQHIVRKPSIPPQPPLQQQYQQPQQPQPYKPQRPMQPSISPYQPTKPKTTLIVGVIAVVIMVIIASILSFTFLKDKKDKEEGIIIDGKFDDWNNITCYSDSMIDQNNTNVNILEYKINKDDIYLSFYLKVEGKMLSGTETMVDTVRIFIDSDQNIDSGYLINGIGADHMLDIYGNLGTALSSSYYEFDTKRANNDWNGWKQMVEIRAECKESEIEVQIKNNDINLKENVIVTFQTAGFEDNEDFSDYVISLREGALVVGQENIAKSVLTEEENEMLRLKLTAKGSDMIVNGIEIDKVGNIETYIETKFPFKMVIDEEKVLFVKVGTKNATNGTIVGVFVNSLDIEKGAWTIIGRGDRAYVKSVPEGIVIDGIFKDWKEYEPYKDNIGDTSNPNIDITEYNCVIEEKNASFYLKIDGEMMAGVSIPSNKSRLIPLDGNTGGKQEEHPLLIITGEDIAIIFIDADKDIETGEKVNNKIGADYMIKIKGRYGYIFSEFFKYNGENKDWEIVEDVNPMTVCGSAELEVLIERKELGNVEEMEVYFKIIDWKNNNDYSDVIKSENILPIITES